MRQNVFNKQSKPLLPTLTSALVTTGKGDSRPPTVTSPHQPPRGTPAPPPAPGRGSGEAAGGAEAARNRTGIGVRSQLSAEIETG